MDNGECKIGDFVKCQVIINLQCMVFFIKCFMGQCYFELINEVSCVFYKVVKGDNDMVCVDIDGWMYIVQEIFVMVLQKMKKIVEDFFG